MYKIEKTALKNDQAMPVQFPRCKGSSTQVTRQRRQIANAAKMTACEQTDEEYMFLIILETTKYLLSNINNSPRLTNNLIQQIVHAL
jgi:hypothetical protein